MNKKQIIIFIGFNIEWAIFVFAGYLLSYKYYFRGIILLIMGFLFAFLVGKNIEKEAIKNYKLKTGGKNV